MPDRTFLPKEAAYAKALQRQTYFNGGVNMYACLYKDTLSANEVTALADYLAHEANFDGYARATLDMNAISLLGGTAWFLFGSGTALFTYHTPSVPPVSNNIGGLFVLVETAAGPPAVYDLGMVITFDPILGMGVVGDVISKLVGEIEGN